MCEDGASLSSEIRSVRGNHSLLAQLASGLDLILCLERVNLVGVDLDRMLHLFHALFFVWVDLYSTIRRIFSYRRKMHVEGLPLVVDIP